MTKSENKKKKPEETVDETVINISFALTGEAAVLFNQYKEKEFLEANSEAGRRLLKQCLYQVMKPSSQPVTV